MPAAAAADDSETPVITKSDTETPGAPAPGTTWLELNPMFAPQLQGLGTVEAGQRASLRLGPRAVARFEGAWWQNEEGRLPATDVPGLGWRAGMHLDYEIAHGVRVVIGGALYDVESIYGRGRYTDVGIALVRTWKLSRWTTIWLSLGAGMRTWLGDTPPAGEANAGTIMLRLGGTFR